MFAVFDVGAFQGAGRASFPAPSCLARVLGLGGAGEPRASCGEQVRVAAISRRGRECFWVSERRMKASLDLLKGRGEPLPMGRQYES